jgi:hypothetical protein
MKNKLIKLWNWIAPKKWAIHNIGQSSNCFMVNRVSENETYYYINGELAKSKDGLFFDGTTSYKDTGFIPDADIRFTEKEYKEFKDAMNSFQKASGRDVA